MIRKYEPKPQYIEAYAHDVIMDRYRLMFCYRQDVYDDFMRMYPDCGISSNQFTRKINKIFNTKVKLVSCHGEMVYIFVDINYDKNDEDE